jgi:hypothetical protein
MILPFLRLWQMPLKQGQAAESVSGEASARPPERPVLQQKRKHSLRQEKQSIDS